MPDPVHMRVLDKNAICGQSIVVPPRHGFDPPFTSQLAEVTCLACRHVITVVGSAYASARRGHLVDWALPEPARRTRHNVVEELADDGSWKLFDVRALAQEPVGEYSLLVRVRKADR